MKNRIKLTESELNRIVNESVRRVIIEGQGWNKFKNIYSNVNNYSDEDWDEYYSRKNKPEYQKYDKFFKNNFIKYGDPDNHGSYFYDYRYYDNNGDGTNNPDGNKRINRGHLGRIGRWAGANAGEAYTNLRGAMNRVGRRFKK